MTALTQQRITFYHRYIDNYAKAFAYQIEGNFIKKVKSHLTDSQVPELEQKYGPDIVVAYLVIQARKDMIAQTSIQASHGLVESNHQIYDWLTKVFSLSELTLNGRSEYLNIFDRLQDI